TAGLWGEPSSWSAARLVRRIVMLRSPCATRARPRKTRTSRGSLSVDGALDRSVQEARVVADVDRIVDRQRAFSIIGLLRERDRHGHFGARVVEAEDERSACESLLGVCALRDLDAIFEALGDDGHVLAVARQLVTRFVFHM